MKKNLFYMVSLIGGLTFAASTVSAQNAKQDNEAIMQQNVQYTCPMHKEIISDKPGKCPKCGMDLVAIKNVQSGTMIHHSDDSTSMHHQNMMIDSTEFRQHQMLNDSTNHMQHNKMNQKESMKHEHHQM